MNRDVKLIDRQIKAIDDLLRSYDRLLTHGEGPKSSLAILILQGHLLIEEQLAGILKDALGIPELPEKENPLEFAQKYQLVKEILIHRGPKKVNADSLIPVKSLNTIRNKLAHNLLQEIDMSKYINELIVLTQRNTTWKPKNTDSIEQQMTAALRIMYGFLVNARATLQISSLD